MDILDNSPSSPSAALVDSFRQLLLDTSGDLDTLKTFDDLLTDEIERASSSGSSSESINSSPVEEKQEEEREEEKEEEDDVKQPVGEDNPQLPSNPSPLVEQKLNYLSADNIQSVLPDIDHLFLKQHSRKKYAWLSKVNIPYMFGGKSYQAQLITSFANVTTIMDKLNADLGLELDSCLVIRYQSKQQFLSLHQDNEDIIDQSHSICNVSIGSARKLEFWDSPSEETGQLISKLTLAEGSLVRMKPGCQTQLWHKVPRGEENDGVRYALSFRKVKLPPPQTPSFPRCQISPLDHTAPLMTPFHLSRLDDTVEVSKIPTHLIIGDSLTKGLTNPDSIIISKGGAHPKDILELLHNSSSTLHPDDYHHIKTVTLCVGTNALNVLPDRRIPMLDVISDYDKLVRDLIGYFPHAHIGLFNVLPRLCHLRETYHRIRTFNIFGQHHIAGIYPNVFWIPLYWEFVDEVGCLVPSLYGKRFLHLSPAGKSLMSDSIREFQEDFKPYNVNSDLM